MRRRERAVTADIRLDVDSEEKLSNMSPIFTHRMINLSPLFNIRNNNYLVRASIFLLIARLLYLTKAFHLR